MSYDFFKVVM